MPTRQSPAAIRAFNYAIESIHNDEMRAGFRRDHARMVEKGLNEFTIIQVCQSAALTMAYMDARERAVTEGDVEMAAAITVVIRSRTARA